MQLATLRMHDAAARESRIRIAEAIDKHFVENQGNDDRLASREVGVGLEKLPVQESGIDIRFTSIAVREAMGNPNVAPANRLDSYLFYGLKQPRQKAP
jgi:hypothetical protein